MKFSTIKGAVWVASVVTLLATALLTVLMAYIFTTNYWDRIQKAKAKARAGV